MKSALYLIHNLFKICLAAVCAAVVAFSFQASPVTILSLSFEGNKGIDSNQLKTQLRINREGGWYQQDSLQYDLAVLENIYHDQGFVRAKVGPPVVEVKNLAGRQGAVIRIPVSEGPLYTVGEIRVTNVHAFHPSSLVQMCPLRTGQPFSRKKISDWLAKIQDGYYTMGYIRFQSSIKEEIREARRAVDLVLDCREGNAYSVGKITVDGDASIDPSDFKRHLLVGEGGLYNPEMISLTIQFLNEMRKFRPISESDIEIKVDDAQSTVDFIFHLSPIKKFSGS